MSVKEKASNLAIVVWFNLIIGIYNIYVFQENLTAFNLTVGILNIGVWVFLRNNTLRVAYIRNKS